MSSRYTSDGRRKSSMTHATRGKACQFCGRVVFGNGGKTSHARSHVRAGDAVELVREFGLPVGTSRVFLASTADLTDWLARGYMAAGTES